MKVLIVYGSTTGNTASIAEALAKQIDNAGHAATLLNAADATVNGMCEGYDAVLLGCSAWGTDTIELQDDFQPIFDDLDKTGIKGKKAAAFASGDSSFEFFCGSVDAIEEALKGLDAEIMEDGLKIEGDYSGSSDDVDDWGARIIAAL